MIEYKLDRMVELLERIETQLDLLAAELRARPRPQSKSEVIREWASLKTPAEAADYLGVKVSTLGVWRSTGARSRDLPYLKIGGKIMYDPVDLEQFVMNSKMEHTAKKATT